MTDSATKLTLRQQIVTATSSDPSPNELPDRRGLGQHHARIDIWSIAFASRDMRLINQQLQFASNFFVGEVMRNLLVDRNRFPVTRDLVRSLPDRFNHFIAHMCWMRVKQAHPEFTFDLLNFAKQYRESWCVSRIDRLPARFRRP